MVPRHERMDAMEVYTRWFHTTERIERTEMHLTPSLLVPSGPYLQTHSRTRGSGFPRTHALPGDAPSGRATRLERPAAAPASQTGAWI